MIWVWEVKQVFRVEVDELVQHKLHQSVAEGLHLMLQHAGSHCDAILNIIQDTLTNTQTLLIGYINNIKQVAIQDFTTSGFLNSE